MLRWPLGPVGQGASGVLVAAFRVKGGAEAAAAGLARCHAVLKLQGEGEFEADNEPYALHRSAEHVRLAARRLDAFSCQAERCSMTVLALILVGVAWLTD